MKKELNNKKKPIFPDESEIERITKYFSDPNCKEINIGLMPNASELDKAKYDICQSISRYKRVNKITPNELAKKISVNKEKVDNILFGRITELDLENLVYLTEKLEIKIETNKSFLSITLPFYASRSSQTINHYG